MLESQKFLKFFLARDKLIRWKKSFPYYPAHSFLYVKIIRFKKT